MGADLRITRTARGGGGPAIEPADVRRLIDDDASLTAESVGDDMLGVRWDRHPGRRAVLLRLERGDLVARDADRATAAKLAEIARALGARLVDEGGSPHAPASARAEPLAPPGRPHPDETAPADASATGEAGPGRPARRDPPGGTDRRSFFRTLLGRSPGTDARAGAGAADAPFREGDRVRDVWGNVAVVVNVRATGGGAGDFVEIRYPDGRVVRRSLITHGLQKVAGEP